MRKNYPKIPCEDKDCRFCKAGHCVGYLVKGAVCPHLTEADLEKFRATYEGRGWFSRPAKDTEEAIEKKRAWDEIMKVVNKYWDQLGGV